MLNKRIRKIEEHLKGQIKRKKEPKIWIINIISCGSESSEKVEQIIKGKIAAGEVKHPSGTVFSKDSENFFITIVPVSETSKENNDIKWTILDKFEQL